MTKKLHIGLLFGGVSPEHEISVLSARNIYAAIDKSKYDVSLIRIDKSGYWHLRRPADLLRAPAQPEAIDGEIRNKVFLSPAHDAGQLLRMASEGEGEEVIQAPEDPGNLDVDVIFPILHGANGEDGTIQGLLKLVNMPFVGASVAGSVLGMDKDIMKRLLKAAGLPIPRFVVIHRHERDHVRFDELGDSLGLPFFVKPANTGSSVGISKVSSAAAFEAALDDAFRYDNKILVEEGIKGREIECAVIGNEYPEASITGEIITKHSFYSYDAKYLDESGTTLVIPADIPDAVSDRVRALSIEVYRSLCCEGMGRVDFFLKDNDEVVINEINTIPGFTAHSMFPVLWEHTGLPPTKLIDKLISLAIERHERDAKLQKTR